ncbi:hypothetical protein NEHOM01_0203 [Nematocida homosporus]|uniref:uncharacterized protein n=1 Tax=Nematocida homosporus TaxID=1912981 RepID=UPI0022210488|nr:uncharacterized protein NEHOM01_0203 [Nematocida homosporus]KAI5184528.1 hypothetical protein NEHOM01_0203 [Nematocida homosporus]
MDIQERAALIASRLKAATYPGDKKSALEEALKLTEEDTLIGGTYFLDVLTTLIKDPEIEKTPLLYQILNHIFTSPNGLEFMDIFCKKDNILPQIITYLLSPTTDEIPELMQTIRTIAKQKQKQLTTYLISSPNQTKVFEEAFYGREIVIDVLVILFKSSNTLKKLLIFNGFLEGMLKLSQTAKEREISRKSLLSIAELLNNSPESIEYFLELSWSTWLAKMLKLHPHHTLKIIYVLAAFPKSKSLLVSFLPTLIDLNDLLSIYLLTTNSSELPTSHLSLTQPLLSQLHKLLTKSLLSSCPMRWNCTLGIYTNLSHYNILSTGPSTYSLGDLPFLAQLIASLPTTTTTQATTTTNSTSPTLDETDLALFLYKLPQITTTKLNSALTYLKTAVLLLLNPHPDPIISSPDILFALREILENEEVAAPLKSLTSFWLLQTYLYLHRHNEAQIQSSVFKNLPITITPPAQALIAAQFTSIPSNCTTQHCKRCYFAEISATSAAIPPSFHSLANPLWFPAAAIPSLLSTFTQYLTLSIPPPFIPPPSSTTTTTPSTTTTQTKTTPPNPTKPTTTPTTPTKPNTTPTNTTPPHSTQSIFDL